jgi:hypothetical protein
MKYLKLYALLALLLTAGGVTTHAQTEDDFWMEINPPTTGICSLIAYYITNEAIASDENLSEEEFDELLDEFILKNQH